MSVVWIVRMGKALGPYDQAKFDTHVPDVLGHGLEKVCVCVMSV